MPERPEPPGAKPPKVGLVKSTFSFTHAQLPAQTINSILHNDWTDATNHTTADLNSLATYLVSEFTTLFMTYLSNQLTFNGVTCLSLGGDGAIGAASGGTAGSNASAALPPGSACVISWQAGATWRGGRFRTYLSGMHNGALTAAGNPELTAVFAGDIAAAADSFASAVASHEIGTVTAPLVGVSYYTKYTLRPAPITFPFVTALVHQRIDSQRRRNGKERSFPVHA